IRGGDAAIASLGIQLQHFQIPLPKTGYIVFFECGVWPGNISAGTDAALLPLANLPVLFGGQLPKRHEFRELIIPAFNRVFIHQPIHSNGGALRAYWKESSAHAMIATRMVPEIGQRADAQGA